MISSTICRFSLPSSAFSKRLNSRSTVLWSFLSSVMASTAGTLPTCAMDQTTTYAVRAFNTATASDNKIHDDEVARRFGFSGGLVPGVDVYAYLTRAPAAAWGLE